MVCILLILYFLVFLAYLAQLVWLALLVFFTLDLRSSLLTLGIVDASITLLSLNRSLHSSLLILHSSLLILNFNHLHPKYLQPLIVSGGCESVGGGCVALLVCVIVGWPVGRF